MKKIIKALLLWLPEKWRNAVMLWRMRAANKQIVEQWISMGTTASPPHAVKQLLIDEHRKKHESEILVETGTYLGDMIMAQIDRFEAIYSIELSPELAQKAGDRFRKYEHVHVLQGDSSKVLTSMLTQIQGRVLFWLDGHYSAGITAKGDTDCPVRDELNAILQSGIQQPVIIIDDAREFTGEHDYPSIPEIEQILTDAGYVYELKVMHDAICITPK